VEVLHSARSDACLAPRLGGGAWHQDDPCAQLTAMSRCSKSCPSSAGLASRWPHTEPHWLPRRLQVLSGWSRWTTKPRAARPEVLLHPSLGSLCARSILCRMNALP